MRRRRIFPAMMPHECTPECLFSTAPGGIISFAIIISTYRALASKNNYINQ